MESVEKKSQRVPPDGKEDNMRKLVVTTFLTLDGVMQAPGGPEEDPESAFKFGGWSVTHFDNEVGNFMGDTMGKEFDLVLGRKTYEIFASHWPHATDETADQLNGATKHVASRTLDSLEWQNSHLIEGDVAEGIAKLKDQDGPELQVHGSANLIQTLLEHDLVDEFYVLIFPVVVGKGKRLFDQGTMPAGLKLTESKVSPSGVVMARYQRDGEVPIGTFGD